jgi:poly-gamma-glutamate synthase PgsB/CapB
VAYPLAIGACLAVLLVLGAWERVLRDRARHAVPIRIHVNGTRGKSTVTRLIWGALREAGIPAVAKTTGTAARLLLPDGSECPVRRLAPPSIREQLWLLRRAHRAGARAVVAECMAIQPELQWVSERDMVSATIAVVTNVRTDHTDAMGSALDQIAETLANTTPANGILVVGDRRFLPVFERRAAALGTRVVAAAPGDQGDGSNSGWEQANRAVALAVTRHLGIPDPVALDGMRKAQADPGAVKVGTALVGNRQVRFIDATAANDPESLALLLDGTREHRKVASADGADAWHGTGTFIAVYNHRDDRGTRLRVFAEGCPGLQNAAGLILTGDRPSLSLLRLVRSRRGPRPVQFVGRARLGAALADMVRTQPETAWIMFCGNTRGLDVGSLFEDRSHTGSELPIPNP